MTPSEELSTFRETSNVFEWSYEIVLVRGEDTNKYEAGVRLNKHDRTL